MSLLVPDVPTASPTPPRLPNRNSIPPVGQPPTCSLTSKPARMARSPSSARPRNKATSEQKTRHQQHEVVPTPRLTCLHFCERANLQTTPVKLTIGRSRPLGGAITQKTNHSRHQVLHLLITLCQDMVKNQSYAPYGRTDLVDRATRCFAMGSM